MSGYCDRCGNTMCVCLSVAAHTADPSVLESALRELHDAVVNYLAEFDYPTRGDAWEHLRRASADAAVILKLAGRFGDAT